MSNRIFNTAGDRLGGGFDPSVTSTLTQAQRLAFGIDKQRVTTLPDGSEIRFFEPNTSEPLQAEIETQEMEYIEFGPGYIECVPLADISSGNEPLKATAEVENDLAQTT